MSNRFGLSLVIAGAIAGAVTLAMAALTATQAIAGPRPAAEPAPAKADAELLRDDAKATSEFQRRLRDQVSLRDGMLMVEDRSAEWSVTVLPPTTLWTVDCSEAGLSVTFGAGAGETDNGIAVQLTSVTMTADKCRALAPALGKTVQAIVKGEPLAP